MSYPTYLCIGKTTTGDTSTVDIQAAYQEHTPPVLHLHVSGTINYTVYGSHNLVNWIPYYTGTNTQGRDFVISVRYWKVTVNSISGSLTADVGPVPDINGKNVMPSIVPAGWVAGA